MGANKDNGSGKPAILPLAAQAAFSDRQS